MAAAALTSEDAGTVEERLSHIAGIAHWRHVFLIAASRCFSEDAFHHRRLAVAGIPRVLECTETDLLVRNGALLALDMFADGLGIDHPMARRQLALHAMELLSLGPEGYDQRLPELWEDLTAGVIEDALRDRLKNGAAPSGLSAWRMLLALVNGRCRHLAALAELMMPVDAKDIFHALRGAGLPLPTATVVAQVRQRILAKDPRDVREGLSSFLRSMDRVGTGKTAISYPSIKELDFCDFSEHQRLEIGLLSRQGGGPVSVLAVPVDDDRFAMVPALQQGHRGWACLATVGRFAAQPSSETLADTLSSLATNEATFGDAKWIDYLSPWPVAGLLSLADGPEALRSLAVRARAGEFGDIVAWRAAEARWREIGITYEDLNYANRIGEFFDANVARLGLPCLSTYMISHGGLAIRDRIVALAQHVSAVQPGVLRKKLVSLIKFAVIGVGPESRIDRISDAHLLLNVLDEYDHAALFPDVFQVFDDSLWRDDRFVDRLATLALRCSGKIDRPLGISVDVIAAAYQRDPEGRRALLYACAVWLAVGREVSDLRSLSSIPQSALEVRENDPPLVRISLALIAAVRGTTDPDEFACALNDGDEVLTGVTLATHLLAREVLPDDRREALLAALVRQLDAASPNLSAEIRSPLKAVLDRRRSGFVDESVWQRLRLPADSFSALLRTP